MKINYDNFYSSGDAISIAIKPSKQIVKLFSRNGNNLFSMENLKTLSVFIPMALLWSGMFAKQPVPANVKQGGLLFMENKGQVQDQYHAARPDILFMAQNGGITIFIDAQGLHYQFEKANVIGDPKTEASTDLLTVQGKEFPKEMNINTYRVDMRLLGANQNPEVLVDKPNGYYENFYNIPAFPKGITGVRSFERIVLKNIYPQIDWVLYSREVGMEYDFVIHPGGNPSLIKMKYDGPVEMLKGIDGRIKIITPLGEVTENAPLSFIGNGETVTSSFEVKENIVCFNLASYPKDETLTIDPALEWATYYGGTGDEGSAYSAVSIDASGNVYLSGTTSSSNAIASGGHQNTPHGFGDAFLVKFNNSGILQWGTYYGGSANDYGTGCATDGTGNVHLVGYTNSSDLYSNNSFSGGSNDAFIVRFNSAGVYQKGWYIGGTASDQGYGCATDVSGNVYLAGQTSSTTGINLGSGTILRGTSDAFLVQFNSSLTRVWGTYYGGSSSDVGYGAAADGSGNFYLTGRTNSSGLVFGGHQTSFGGGSDAFLVKFDNTRSELWSTYYGGNDIEDGTDCTTDALGNVYLCGDARSTYNIFSGGHQSTFGGVYDGFLVKFNSSGVRQWGTYYGGSGTDIANSCVTDASGNVFISGTTTSNNNIASSGLQNTIGGAKDAFIVKFNSSGIRQWGSYYGGTGNEECYSDATDALGNVYFGGYTTSTSGIASGGHQNTFGGGTYDFYLVKIDDNPSVSGPGNLTVSASSSCNAIVNYTTSSAGPPAPVVTFAFTGATVNSGSGDGSGSTFNLGTTTVTLTATNSNGTATCSFDVTVNPGVEICNGIDDDCDGLIDDLDPSVTGQPSWYIDADGDGYGNLLTTIASCSQPVGYVSSSTDCNDVPGSGTSINPGAAEICDGIDNDCDGLIDDQDPSGTGGSLWYADADGDGYGNLLSTIITCIQPVGYLANSTDCNDIPIIGASIHPGATEICNGVDDDCDGLIDDLDPSVTGQPTWYADADGDGYGNLLFTTTSCSQPVGFVPNSNDCNDVPVSGTSIHPGATEICNRIDDDCNGLIDDINPAIPSGIWIGVTSSDWFTANNWCGGVPVSSTDVVISSGTNFSPIINTLGATCHNLTIDIGANLTIENNMELTVSGDWINNGSLNENGGTVYFSGITTISGTSTNSFYNVNISGTLTGPASANMNIAHNWSKTGTFIHNNGTITFNGNNISQSISGSNVFYNLTINHTGSFNVLANGTLTVDALMLVQSGVFFSATNYHDVQIGPAGILISAGGGTTNVSGNWINDGSYAANGGTVIFNGHNNTQIISGSGYNAFDNLIINHTGIPVNVNASGTLAAAVLLRVQTGTFTTAATTYINNDLQIDPGATFASAPGGNIGIFGNWINNGSFTHNNGSINFASMTTISGSSTNSFFDVFISLNNTLVGPPGGTINIAHNWLNNGTFTHNNCNVNFNGTSTITGLATNSFYNVTVSGILTGPPSGNMNVACNWSNSGTFNHNNGNVIFNGNANFQIISGANVFNNLTISHSGIGSVSATGSILSSIALLEIQSGIYNTSNNYVDVQIDPSGTLICDAGGTINISGNWTNNGSFASNGGTVVFNGINNVQVISGSGYNGFANLIINHTGSPVNVNASGSLGASTLLHVQSGIFTTAATTYLNNDLQIDPGATFVSAPSGTIGIFGNWINNGTFVHNNGSVNFANSTTISGSSTNSFFDVFISLSNELISAPGGTINVEHNWLNNGAFTHNNGTVNFNGNGAVTGSATTSFYHVIVSGTLTGPLSANMNIAGDWTNNGTFNSNNSVVTFNGITPQNINGSTAPDFNYISLNNSNGLSLSSVDVIVSGMLTLLSGNITTGTNKVIVESTGSVSRTSGYVNGNMQKNFPTNNPGTTTFKYDVGDEAAYAPATLDMTNVDASVNPVNVTASVSASDANESYGSGIDQIAKGDHYWFMTENNVHGSFSTYDISLDLSNTINSGTPGGSIVNYIIKKFDPFAWATTTNSIISDVASNRVIKASGLNNFSDFEAGECNPPEAPDVTVLDNCNGTSILTAAGYSGSLTWSDGGSDNPHIVSLAGSYTCFQTIDACAGKPSIPVTATPVSNISDDDVCTIDACNSLTGEITHTPVEVDDGNACTFDGCNSVTGIFHTPVCIVTLNSNIFIQGYYTGGGLMDNGGTGGCLFVAGVSLNPSDADDITVSAMNSSSPYGLVDVQIARVKINGDLSVTFTSAVISGNSYYLKVNHRNSVETWSKIPVLLTTSTSYSFSSAATQAFGDNMSLTFDNLYYAIYNGDVNQDGAVDGSDFLDLDPSIQNGDGGYAIGDINGDGAVDGSDFLILDPNVQNGIGAAVPSP